MRLLKAMVLLLQIASRNLHASKPRVINLNANDICNSKCVMCNIWQQKRDSEISGKQLSEILKDPLFSKVRHVGITGGEPTLRPDLVNLYSACINTLPHLTGLSIITNGIQAKQIIKRIGEVSQVCNEAGIQFSVMLSIDGVGHMHDRVRGRKGNFQSAVEVLHYLKQHHKDISLSIGCTITKTNVWAVDSVLDFAIENGIYCRFRVAEFINRLYNNNLGTEIRNFDEEEVYNLKLFFTKLIRKYEKDDAVKRTYQSVLNILNGGKRLTGCPYQKEGVVLNSKGELSYCAPKSSILGSALDNSAESIYHDNLVERERILREDCQACIHDYHAPITFPEYFAKIRLELKVRLFSIRWWRLAKILASIVSGGATSGVRSILIVGWYGTETVGDKAILGGIVGDYISKYGQEGAAITVASLYPFVTRKTIQELGLRANVIDTSGLGFLQACRSADEVVMGGGPLMDLEELWIPLLAFSIGRSHGAKTIIKGCGIGPLQNDRFRRVVGKILRRADYIGLRDEGSKSWAQRTFGISAHLEKDPAVPYIIGQRVDEKVSNQKYIACFLRELPKEYFSMRPDVFTHFRTYVEEGLARYLIKLSKEHSAPIRLFHMHNFVIGGDDRDFSRRFIRGYFGASNSRIFYDEGLSTVNSTIMAMKGAKLNVCMRYHSVLFAQTLQVPFVGIDYTNGGKVRSYLRDVGQLEKLLTLQELAKPWSAKEIESPAY